MSVRGTVLSAMTEEERVTWSSVEKMKAILNDTKMLQKSTFGDEQMNSVEL